MAVNYAYIGHVMATLTAREGPGSNYPVVQNAVYCPGDDVKVHSKETVGDETWGILQNGTFLLVRKGGNSYIDLEPTDPLQTVQHIVKKNNGEYVNVSNMLTYSSPIGPQQPKKETKSVDPYSVGEFLDASSAVPDGIEVDINGSEPVSKASMRLFGLPYQFNPACDIRYENVSTIVGREFANKFFVDGPIMYVIPGRAKYTKSEDKNISSHALIMGAHDDLGPLKADLERARKQPLMFYDFEEDYTSYMHYVNVMCRTVAGFMQLREKINDGSNTIDLQKFDWRNYRWTSDHYRSTMGLAAEKVSQSAKSLLSRLISVGRADAPQAKTVKSNTLEVDLDDQGTGTLDLNLIGENDKYVMFYVDPSTTCNESFSNNTGESDLQQKIDGLAASSRDMAFYAKSAGAEGALDTLGNATASLFGDGLMNMGGPISNVLNKIVSAGSAVVRGENIILPEIYQNSSYSKDYQVQIHLKTPYGDKLAIYMDVIVPMLHILALTLPKQGTQNTYGTPFLIKAYVPGVFNCSLGVVASAQFDRARTEDAWSVDGLPMEVDVTLTIKDLYTKLSMSPSNEPLMFMNNSSLIDYLANVAGLNLILPQLENKVNMMIDTATAAISDIKANVGSLFTDAFDKAFSSFVNL